MAWYAFNQNGGLMNDDGLISVHIYRGYILAIVE